MSRKAYNNMLCLSINFEKLHQARCVDTWSFEGFKVEEGLWERNRSEGNQH